VALCVPRIDQLGQVIDVLVSTHRDVKAVRRFLQRAIGITKATPVEVVTDRAPVYPLVLEELLPGPGTALSSMPTTGSRPTMAE
jgi:transposase-like protein